MHIARVSHLFYPDIISDYLFEFSIRQISIGHNIDVLTWNKSKRPSEENVADGFTINRLPGYDFSLGGPITDYPCLPSLPDKIEKLKSEIMHAESHLFLTTVQAVRKAKELGIPSVVTVHGVMAKRNIAINLAQYAYLHTLGLWLFKNTDRVICLTEGDAQEIVRFGCPSEKIRVIPNAVDTNRFRPRKESPENLVMWVGRFEPEKGLSYLIEAARIVVKKLKNVGFMLVGYGPLKVKVMELARSSGLLNNAVRFAGPFERDQVANILGEASIFVLPSLKEGLPLSLLEAMACGKPVIGSDISGINSVITNWENGLLIPHGNHEALADAVLTLLSDENLRRRLGQSARQLMMEKYSWNMVIDKVEKVYNEAINEV